jgi:radical SAM superfamily enzyme YgiQ (UPF0313 family)
MNVLFVYTAKEHKYRKWAGTLVHMCAQLGISYISSVLKKAGHQTQLLVCCQSTPDALIERTIQSFKPSIICFTAVYSEYDFCREIAGKIRKISPEIFLLAGGVHTTLNPEETIQDEWDAICIGEGEYPTLELVNKMAAQEPLTGIQNLWFKNGGNIERNSCRDFIQDLSQLPYPDRKMWEPWVMKRPGLMMILLGRGCPFDCTYCCNHALKKVAGGSYVRIRDVDDIMGEVVELARDYPSMHHISFEIETIGVHQDVIFSLAARLKEYNQSRKKPLTFDINLRIVPGLDLESLFVALKAANFTDVNIGLESGSDTIRRKYLNRRYSNDDIRNAVRIAKQTGIAIGTYVLIGIPGERLEDFEETEALLREIQPKIYISSIVFPYPGTKMAEYAKEITALPDKQSLWHERARATMDLPGFSKKEIEKQFDWIPYRVYKGYRNRLLLLCWVIWRKLCKRGFLGWKYYGV